MNRWWRFCLVWCLVLALPVKGWAVAAMPCQMPSTQTDKALPPCHEQVMQDDVAHSSGAVSADPAASMLKACSLCMSGATVASLPAFDAWLPPVPLVTAGPIPFQVQAFVSHVPDGLDPPPRRLLV